MASERQCSSSGTLSAVDGKVTDSLDTRKVSLTLAVSFCLDASCLWVLAKTTIHVVHSAHTLDMNVGHRRVTVSVSVGVKLRWFRAGNS